MSEATDQTIADREAEFGTPGAISAVARRLFMTGPRMLRSLQHYRPFICPFEEMIGHVPTGSSVLDVGCGGGLWLGLLWASGRIRSGVGFDSSSKAIELARHMSAPTRVSDGPEAGQLEFRCVPVEEPWPEGPFDVVSVIDVMHHVPRASQMEVIRLAATRLRAGGVLIYKDMCSRPLWRAAANRVHDLVLARQWIRYAPVAQVERWAGEHGLKLVHSRDSQRLWYGHELRVFVKMSRTGMGELDREALRS